MWSWRHFVLISSDSFPCSWDQDCCPSHAPGGPAQSDSHLPPKSCLPHPVGLCPGHEPSFYLRCVSFCRGHPIHFTWFSLILQSLVKYYFLTPLPWPPTYVQSPATPCFSFRTLVTVEVRRLGCMFNVSDCELCKGRDRDCIHCLVHSTWHRLARSLQ